MGNVPCPAEDTAHLASVARDICPFPNYNPNPLYLNLLSNNSLLHLKNHYTAVQSSLTEKQLDLFNQGLRTTFGREGRVTLGGVGVVALSLALFFDTLSKQVKEQYVPESGIISDLFVKDPRGYYPPSVYTLSEYLRLVPYIANNPTRMREETERYLYQLMADEENLDFKERKTDVLGINILRVLYLQKHMIVHFVRINNSTVNNEKLRRMFESPSSEKLLFEYFSTIETSSDQSKLSKKTKRGFSIKPMESNFTLNFNCDPERASERFWAEMQKSNVSLEAFNRCQMPLFKLKTSLHFVAVVVWLKTSESLFLRITGDYIHILGAQREAFDFKSNALKEWPKQLDVNATEIFHSSLT